LEPIFLHDQEEQGRLARQDFLLKRLIVSIQKMEILASSVIFVRLLLKTD